MHFKWTIVFWIFTTLLVEAQEHPNPPEPRSQETVQTMLSGAPRVSKNDMGKLHIVLLASAKDHGPHEHDYPLWQKNWSLLLGGEKSKSDANQINMYGPPSDMDQSNVKDGAYNVTVESAWDWPTEEQFESADIIVAFSVMPWSKNRNAELKKYLNDGGGFVTIHMSCVVGDRTGLDDEVNDLIGLSWNWDISRWRHGPMNLDIVNSNHPICLGLPQQMFFLDEAYWPLFGDRTRVEILATSKESTKNFALRDDDGNIIFSNMEAIQQKWPEEPTKDEPIFWTYEYGQGRVFGSILGHYSWTFDDPFFRTLMLRGIAWAAGDSPYRFDPLILRGSRVK